MADFTQMKLTDLGLTLQTKVQGGATLVFTRYGLGSGSLVHPDDVPVMTALVDEKLSLSVDEVSIVDDTHYQVKRTLAPADLPLVGFEFKELGLFAQDPDVGEILYGVMYAGNPDYIPATGASYEQVINVVGVVSDIGNVTLTINPVALASKQDIIDHVNNTEHGAIPAGTSMLFNQASAPVGWTKKDDWAANASLIVGNTFGSGGSNSPTSWSTGISISNHPSHTHSGPNHRHTGPSHTHTINHTHASETESLSNPGDNFSFATEAYTGNSGAAGTGYTSYNGTGNTGSGGSASHSITQGSYTPRYQAVIAASKD